VARHKLNLIGRAEFGQLRLHEKNAYLQRVAREIAQVRGEAVHVPLSKDALARLRRFYSRRSIADLKLDQVSDDDLRTILRRLSDAIRHDEIEKVILHELPAKPNTRPAPEDDAQLMFFVPGVHDAPLKDDVNLMDIAPFSLSKMARDGVIRYELKDCIITVEGGAEVGIATAYDYDIFIHMVSHLADQIRDYRIAEQKGLRPGLPARKYRPSSSEILKFCRREPGGKQYLELERALDRLQATRIKITNLDGGRRRETEAFPLIGRYKVVSRTNTDRIDRMEIDIPDWVYEGVVLPGGKPSILTLNRDYFLIAKPIAKFLYRLARKAAGEGEATYSLKELHFRSGSRLPLRKFIEVVEEIVAGAGEGPLPDYDLEIRPGQRGPLLRMVRRAAPALAAVLLTEPLP
jgi:hypothetical protein